MSRIYRHPTQPTVELPPVDLLTLLFDSEHSLAQDDTILHQEAANPSNTVNKRQLRDLVERIAHGLRTNYGIGAQGPNKDVVTVISYGQMLVSAAFFGVIAAGGVYSAASPSSTVAELARQVKIGNSRLLICGKEHQAVTTRAAEECGLPLSSVLLLESSPEWKLRSLEGGIDVVSSSRLSWQTITDRQALKDSLITILWSSGTTGLPKGVMLSHENLVAETYITALSGRQWAAKEIEKGNELPAVQYRTLGHLPISHIAGLFGYLLAPMYSGGSVVWMRKYNWEDMLKCLKQYEITAFYTVPSIFLRISKSPEVTDHFKHLVGASTGAAPMDGKLQMAANAKLGSGQDAMIGQTWGLSETTGAITMMPKGESDTTGSISPILPSVELRMVDDDFNDELLKYKGLQVAPAEIENVLFTHPQIKEAAVVGVPAPDDPGTDWPRAYVVPVAPDAVSEDDVKAWVADRLAPYKQLRGGVMFVDGELPKNAIGKFLRRELRDRAKREMGIKAKL
ncbi:hypothetical protein B0A54_07226 [Friedmanniomyces endolithicus]|uniref:AMP-dependent synthetase/ligase domain-containing protein n=1 Tax=Friedmanniomyces endolithicus TaxID=329885 RepID=A0A4U0V0Q7_9PEZI|nr:hypothetical protein B0A54_07226 [Friedmanniomyces endolithicus]